MLNINNNGKYEVHKFYNLGEGHKAFNWRKNIGTFSYLELGIDKLEKSNIYSIFRRIWYEKSINRMYK